MTKLHYGLPNLRTACGRLLPAITTVRRDVTCQACRSTVAFATEFFTRNPTAEAAQEAIRRITRTHKGTHHRNGARP